MSTPQTLFNVPMEHPRAGSARSAELRLGVFDDNRKKAIHRWYPFIEGYSADLVNDAIDSLPADGVLLDPFGGSGTTALAAAEFGRDCLFCEVNPYLAWVADVKVNQSATAHRVGAHADLRGLADQFEKRLPGHSDTAHPLILADGRRGFFPDGVAAQAVSALEAAVTGCRPEALGLARLAVATSLIPASNMIRRTDLRKRRAGDPPPQPFRQTLIRQLRDIAHDVDTAGHRVRGTAVRVGADARLLPTTLSPIDLVITSPPYLNGTNYCRNTKLELLALGFVTEEQQLADLRLESIAAGINNISRRRSAPGVIPAVESIAVALDEVAYDRRIPAMVRMYFADMRQVFASVRQSARHGARWLLDIGDSRFSGIHVPTHDLLCEVAALEGWQSVSRQTIRSRRSYDGSELTQVLLELRAV